MRIWSKVCLVIWRNVKAYLFAFSGEKWLPWKEGWNEAASCPSVCFRCSDASTARAFSITREWGGNYPWSVNTFPPSTSDLCLASSFSCRPTVDHRASASITNEFIHTFTYISRDSTKSIYGSNCSPPPFLASTHCYFSTHLLTYYYYYYFKASNFWSQTLKFMNPKSAEPPVPYLEMTKILDLLECRSLPPGLNIHLHICHATAAPTTGQRKTRSNTPSAGKNAQNHVLCCDAEQSEAPEPTRGAFKY